MKRRVAFLVAVVVSGCWLLPAALAKAQSATSLEAGVSQDPVRTISSVSDSMSETTAEPMSDSLASLYLYHLYYRPHSSAQVKKQFTGRHGHINMDDDRHSFNDDWKKKRAAEIAQIPDPRSRYRAAAEFLKDQAASKRHKRLLAGGLMAVGGFVGVAVAYSMRPREMVVVQDWPPVIEWREGDPDLTGMAMCALGGFLGLLQMLIPSAEERAYRSYLRGDVPPAK